MVASIRPVFLTLLFFCVTMLCSATAFAANDKAIEFYEQAQAAYGNKDYKLAADLLENAFAQEPDLIYMYNRILALRAAGDPVEALRLLNIYEDPMVNDKQGRFKRDELKQVREALKSEVANAPAPVEPPPTPDVPPVQEQPKPPVVVAVEQPGDVTGPGIAPQESPSNVVPYVLWGTGGAAIVAGTLFATGLFLPDEDAATTQQEVDDYNDSVGTQQIIAGALLGTGVVLGVVGVVLYDSGGSDATTVRIAPTSNGARVSVRF